jgi:hypothetical protein
MTKHEFLKGYGLLTIQPWGKLYRGNGPEATIQMELYYRQVSQANPVVWQAVCESHATGERWPSLSELKTALQANGGYRREQLAIEQDGAGLWEEAPEPLAACFAYRTEHDCTLKEAYLAILPIWVQQNPNHADVEKAEALLEKAQENFGMPLNKAGNVRTPL